MADIVEKVGVAVGLKSCSNCCRIARQSDDGRTVGDVPNHSTFSKNRHGRFRDSDLLRRLFEETVERCIAEGLVRGEGFAVDANLIKAPATWRDIAATEAYVTSRQERKKVEMKFAHLKRTLRLDRLRLRGPLGATDEFLLASTAQNPRKLAELVSPKGTPRAA